MNAAFSSSFIRPSTHTTWLDDEFNPLPQRKNNTGHTHTGFWLVDVQQQTLIRGVNWCDVSTVQKNSPEERQPGGLSLYSLTTKIREIWIVFTN